MAVEIRRGTKFGLSLKLFQLVGGWRWWVSSPSRKLMGDKRSFRVTFLTDLWSKGFAKCPGGSLHEVQRADGLSALSTVGDGVL